MKLVNTSFQKIKAPIFGAFFYSVNAMFLSIILGLRADFEQFQTLDAPFPSKLANFFQFKMKNFL
jgi:hypothetical protein